MGRMQQLLLFLALTLLGCNYSVPTEEPETPVEPDPKPVTLVYKNGVLTTHPRLFITSADIAALKETAQGDGQATYLAIKRRVDESVAKGINFTNNTAVTPSTANSAIGYRAMEAALVWLVSGEEAYLGYTKEMLRKLIRYYQIRVTNSLSTDWYVYPQVGTLCAYDWIYSDLTDAERRELSAPLYEVMYKIAWHGDGVREKYPNENADSGYNTGCYGSNALPWYLSLAFYGDGVDDAQCKQMFSSASDFYRKMATYREQMAGENGGGASPTLGYSFGYYPIADFFYYYTTLSATGKDISEDLGYVRKYLDYLDWARCAGNKQYGFGDDSHRDMGLGSFLPLHISQIAHIYGTRDPDLMNKAARISSDFGSYSGDFVFLNLLTPVKIPSSYDNSSDEASLHARYFDTMGQVYLRSGTGTSDTYCLFVSGGKSTQHKHYDNNHFCIYRNGFRALDTGTRPEPGIHLSHYYARTVAHNCVTIRRQGESFPAYWGSPASGEGNPAVPNDGGQYERLASELKELRQTGDYVYLASDATKAYRSNKASLVMREMVFCMPDVFVIFDRVTSTNASYPKTWLYHLASEPVINGNEFSETSQGGKSICRTLLPKDAQLTKIGGPGKQFWSDGKNWPLPAGYSTPSETWPLVGQWRIEVAPGTAATEDYFLHIIQVGSSGLASLPETELIDTSSEKGVIFSYGGKTWRVTFDVTAASHYGCKVDID